MEKYYYYRLSNLFKHENITSEQVIRVMKCEDFIDALTEIANYINNNLDELVCDTKFISNYYFFALNLIKNVKNLDELYDIKNMVNWTTTVARKNIQKYTKYHEHKDANYALLKDYRDRLSTIEAEVDEKISNKTEKEDFLIIKFLTLDLKNIDYIFKVLETKSYLVNASDKHGNSIFLHIMREFISSADYISPSEVKYFNRLIILFLESNELVLKDDEFQEIYNLLEKNAYKRELRFIKKEFDDSNRFAQKNGFARKNCIDLIEDDNKPQIILPNVNIESRLKFSNLFTISLDGIKNPNHKSFLYDDSFSLTQDTLGNYYLTMHVPDINSYIPKDSELDKHMRSVGESVYIKEYKTPLLDYEIGSKMSLEHGKLLPTLSFIIKLDKTGNLLDIDFKKSYINVNYNLSFAKADTFIASSKDKTLNQTLNNMYKLAKIIQDKYHLKYDSKSKANVITYMFNVLFDIEIAKYFNSRSLVFPYKNYKGKQYEAEFEDVKLSEKFSEEHNFSGEGRDILFGIIDSKNRVYYDTIPIANRNVGGNICGSVGNPLREYISIETDRLISDLLIDDLKNYDYWDERIERDCIDITETSAKIRSLYSSKRD